MSRVCLFGVLFAALTLAGCSPIPDLPGPIGIPGF